MKRTVNTVAGIFAIIIFMVATGALYTVSETQQVVITQFGRPVGEPVTEPGLHVKVPFIQTAHVFEKRLLEWDGDPNQIPTRDKRYIWVDTTARWKVADSLLFLQSVGNEFGAHARLDGIINSATRDIITGHVLVESVRDTNRVLDSDIEDALVPITEDALERVDVGRAGLEDLILERAGEIVPQYGIEILDVRIKRINYVEDVQRNVFQRMISERKRAAERYRSEGRGRSAEIEGQKEKELLEITSGAYRTAQSIIGKADAEATVIYADAYGTDPDFYVFYKTLETYETTVDADTTIVLTTDGDYYRFIKNMRAE